MPTTIVVSVGRGDNKNNQHPLPDADWAEVCTEAEAAIRQYADQVYTVAVGYGEYQGQREECITLVFSIGDGEAPGLKSLLAHLAAEWNQDSIAWLTVAGTEFLGEEG